MKNIQREVEKLSRTLTELKNKRSQKLALLEKENRDTYQGVLWLKVPVPVHKYLNSYIVESELQFFALEEPEPESILVPDPDLDPDLTISEIQKS